MTFTKLSARRLCSGAALIAIACTTTAFAQDQEEDTSSIGDIIVTATRQSTNLQDTPIAITAVTSEDLATRGITNVAELTAVVPNAQFQRTQGAFGPGVSGLIRGIGSGDTNIGGENAIAYYIDDIYYPLVLGANFDLLDIDHIEVLRGPQGTLFGRNALAGAVNIVARAPNPNQASGYIEATGGAFDRVDLRAGFNLPLAENAALRFSGLTKNRDGFVRILDFTCEMQRRGTPQLAGSFPTSNPLATNQPNFAANDCTIGRLGGEQTYGARTSLLWEPTSDITLTLTGDYIRDKSENAPDHVVDIDPARVSTNLRSQANYWGLVIDDRFETGDMYTTYTTYNDRIAAGTIIPGNTYYNGTVVNGRPTRGGYAFDPHVSIKNWGVSAKLEWSVSDTMNLTAVYGHRDLQEYHAFDTDGMPLVVEHTVNDNSLSYDVAELRLTGESELADWVVGGFYFDSHGEQHAALVQGATGGQRSIFTTYDPTSKAVFANATIRPFGERLGIVLGGRYSDDRKVVNFSNLVDISPSASDIRFIVVPEQTLVSWKAGLNFQATPEALFYASAATGNSLPGFNARPLQPSQVSQFDGNNNIAYEVGGKLDLFNRMVRLNAAAFYTDFKNRPATIGGAEALLDSSGNRVSGNQQLIALPGGPDGSTQCSTVTLPGPTGITCIGRTYYRNLPAKIRGFEVEYTIAPIDGLMINGSVGYSKFTSPDIAQRAVNQRQNSPYWTANAGVQYEIAAGGLGGTITPRVDWTFQSSQVVSGTSTKYNYLLPDRSLVNARLTYQNDDGDLSLSLGVTNLFDNQYYVNVFDYQTLGYPQTDAQPGRPREWYLTVRREF
ncbi:MAG: TonB-dependent receptor [Pseudomonadota bacterium]